MFFVYFAAFFLILSPARAVENVSPLGVVERVEKNLIYSNEVEKPDKADGIIIKKGAWNDEDTKKLEEATTEEKKITTEVKKIKNDTTVLALKRKAYDAISVGQYEIAVELYKKALAINKDDVYSTLGLATAYQYLGQYVQAKPLYLKVLEVFPTDQQVMSNLLAIVSDETPYEAVYLLSNIADRNPTSPLIQAQTSMAYSKVKNYDKAIEYIRRAIECDGTNLEYRYNLAVLYDLNQNYNQARAAYGDVLNFYAIGQGDNYSLPVDEIRDRINTINNLSSETNSKNNLANGEQGNKKKK